MKQNTSYIVKEAAIMFEAGSNESLYKIIVVSAPEALRVKRVLKRDTQRTQKQIEEIIRNQMNDAEKLKRADFVILNDETQLVIPQVLALHQQFKSVNAA